MWEGRGGVDRRQNVCLTLHDCVRTLSRRALMGTLPKGTESPLLDEIARFTWNDFVRVSAWGWGRLSLYHEKNWMSPERKKKETFRLLTFNNFIPNGAFWKIMRNNLFASCCLFIYSLRLKMFPLHTHSYLWSILSPVNIIQNLHVFGLRVEDRKAGEITRKYKVNMYILHTIRKTKQVKVI